MANRQVIGLGAVVLGIALAAVLGIRSAASWLSQSESDAASSDTIVSTEANGAGDRGSALNLVESDRNRSSEQIVGQANNADTNQPLSPIEEAGTYIQRQKRVDQDPVVANTPVEVIPTASSDTIASQGTTTVNPQPTAPAAAPAASEPVQALW